MFIRTCKLLNYKNLSLELGLVKNFNVIVAPNATGKTNFLEAVNYVATGKSFRGLADELVLPVKGNCQFASVELTLQEHLDTHTDSIPTLVKFVISSTGIKSLYLNEKKTTAAKINSVFASLVYAPESMDLVTGGPARRREFIDMAVARLSQVGKLALKEYKSVLTRKNVLLKSYNHSASRSDFFRQLEFWNQKLLANAKILNQERLELLAALLPIAESMASQIFHLDLPKLNFAVNAEVNINQDLQNWSGKLTQVFQQKLTENSHKEALVGRSLYGPHKDGYEFTLQALNIRDFGSRGQQRLCSLILHLSLLKLLEDHKLTQPVLLLDDTLSELDPEHRLKTLTFLQTLTTGGNAIQMIMTSADKADFAGFSLGFATELKL